MRGLCDWIGSPWITRGHPWVRNPPHLPKPSCRGGGHAHRQVSSVRNLSPGPGGQWWSPSQSEAEGCVSRAVGPGRGGSLAAARRPVVPGALAPSRVSAAPAPGRGDTQCGLVLCGGGCQPRARGPGALSRGRGVRPDRGGTGGPLLQAGPAGTEAPLVGKNPLSWGAAPVVCRAFHNRFY